MKKIQECQKMPNLFVSIQTIHNMYECSTSRLLQLPTYSPITICACPAVVRVCRLVSDLHSSADILLLLRLAVGEQPRL